MLCPYCQEEIKDGAIKCKHCKSELAPVIQEADVLKRKDILFPVSLSHNYLYLLVVSLFLCCTIYSANFRGGIIDTVFQVAMYGALLICVWILFSMYCFKGTCGVQIDEENVTISIPFINSGALIFKLADIEQCTMKNDKIIVTMERPKLLLADAGMFGVNVVALYEIFMENNDTHYFIKIPQELFSKNDFEDLKQILIVKGTEVGFVINEDSHSDSDLSLSDKIQKWIEDNPSVSRYLEGALFIGGLIAMRYFWG